MTLLETLQKDFNLVGKFFRVAQQEERKITCQPS